MKTPQPVLPYSLCSHSIYILVTFITIVFLQSYSRLGKKTSPYNPIVIIFGCFFFLVKGQFPSNPNLELRLGGVNKLRGRSQTTLTRFCLFLTTYPPSLTFSMVHCKCLQGFTGTLQGNQSAGISNLWGLHVYPQSL